MPQESAKSRTTDATDVDLIAVCPDGAQRKIAVTIVAAGGTPGAHASTHLPGGADPLTTAAPVSVGTANAVGAAASFANSAHVHDHGSQTTGTHHAAATTLVNGFMSTTDKTKVDAVSLTSVQDADADTKWETERTADNDTLHGRAAGFDVITATKAGFTVASSDTGGSAQLTTAVSGTGATGVHSVAFGTESATRQAVLNDPSLGDLILDTWTDGTDTIRSGQRVDVPDSIQGWQADVLIGGVSKASITANYTGGVGTTTLAGDAIVLTGPVSPSSTVDGRDISADWVTSAAHFANTSNPHSTSIANIGSGTLAELNAAVSDANLVPEARTLTGTAPITVDGGASANLSANRIIAITAASGGAAGSMSAAHYTKLDAVSLTSVQDADGDTKWETERTPDDDTLYGRANGLDAIVATKSANTVQAAGGAGDTATRSASATGNPYVVESAAKGGRTARWESRLDDPTYGDISSLFLNDGTDTHIFGMQDNGGTLRFLAALYDATVEQAAIEGTYAAGVSALRLAADSIALVGPVTATSTIDGRDLSVDGAKLDNVSALTFDGVLNATSKDNDATLAEADRLILRATANSTADIPLAALVRTNTGAGVGLQVDVDGTDEAARIAHTGTAGNSVYIRHEPADAALMIDVDTAADVGLLVRNNGDTGESLGVFPDSIEQSGSNLDILCNNNSAGTGYGILVTAGDSSNAASAGGGIRISGGQPGAGGTAGGIAINAHATANATTAGKIRLKSVGNLEIEANGSSAIVFNDGTDTNLTTFNTKTTLIGVVNQVTSNIVQTSRTLTAGVGISGGGTLAADRTFTLDLSELSEIGAALTDSDWIAGIDQSTSSATVKILMTRIYDYMLAKVPMAAGTWTPTLNTFTSLSAVSNNDSRYIRIGNIVHFAGIYSFTRNSATNPKSFQMTLPVSTNFSSLYQATGTANVYAISVNGVAYGETVNDRIIVQWSEAGSSGSDAIYVVGNYRVI
jgi:hypothetical protein